MVTQVDEDGATDREDGRTGRTRRTHAAIIEAHLALLTEGDLRPSAQRIADRSGISVRTLWTHFADMEAVYAATAESILEAQASSHRPIPVSLPLDQRIDRFCRQRARLLEQVAPFARASQLREPVSPMLQQYRSRHVQRVVAEVEELFDAELPLDPAAHREVVHALAAATTWGSWSVLRDHLRLGTGRARQAMSRTVQGLLNRPEAPLNRPEGAR